MWKSPPKPKKRKLRELLEEILQKLLGLEKRTYHFGWIVGQPIAKEKKMPLDLTCTNEEKIEVTAVPVTSTGKPASIDGAISVSLISGNGTASPGSSPLSFFVISEDNPGDSTFLVEADADLGAGVVTIQDTVTLHTVGALATALGLTAGTPVPK